MYTSTLRSMNRKEIAKIAGVSTATISRFYNSPHLLTPQTRAKLKEIIDQSDYKPNIHAARLSANKKGKIAFVCTQIESTYTYQRFQSLYYLLLPECNSQHIRLDVVYEPDNQKFHDEYDAIIYYGGNYNKYDILKNDLILFPDIMPESNSSFSYIHKNDAQGGAMLADLFIPASLLNPLCLLPDTAEATPLNTIIKEYDRHLINKGVTPNPHHKIEGASTFEGGYFLTKEGFSLGLDFHSIITFNQEAALGAILAIKEEELNYPFDMQIVNYSHNKEFYLSNHQITCLSEPFEDIMKSFIFWLEGGRVQKVYPPKLIKGDTY